MRSQNICVVLIALISLTLSCASFTTRPTQPRELGWLYNSITFEIAPITSAEPSPRALEIFRNRLHESHLCHRNGVTFQVRREVGGPPPGLPWNANILAAYESLRRSLYDDDPDDRNLKIFIAYIDGLWVDARSIRTLGGIQYSNTAFAIFKTGAGEREGMVLLHEFGHLIGLVKDESFSNHDFIHPHHCVVQSCVMYYTTFGLDARFDLYCKQQIAAMIRAREAEEDD